MKNKFRIVGIIAGLFSLCSFSSGVNVLYNGTINGKTAYNIPVPAVFTGCNFSVECTYQNSSYIDQVGVFRFYNSTSYSPNNGIGSKNLTPTVHFFSQDFSSYTDCVVPKEIGFNVTYNPNVVDFSCSFSGDSAFVFGGSSSCPECPTCQSCSPFSGKLDLYYYDDGEYINATMFGGKYSVYLPTGLNWVGFEDGDSYGINVSSSVPVCTGDSGNDLSGVNWSLLYINDIQHIGAGIINITIPEEINRDYIYTGNGDQFDLNVSGYNVDSAYIDGIITTQKTLPNSIDFNNVVSVLIPKLIPGLIITSFLLFIFRFIKKIF